MGHKQAQGGETRRRLLDWDKGQTSSERLAAHVLRNEGYESIDPSHPLGGPDGTKDMICVKGNIKFIGASYFPNGKKTLNNIITKFTADLAGVAKNSAEGLAFVTNQKITLAQRKKLERLADPARLDLFHLDKISSILDSPKCYGIRLEFLDIEMTKEDQLAFYATVGPTHELLIEILSHINNSDILREELEKLRKAQNKPKIPHYVTPDLLNDIFSVGSQTLQKCSYCGYGYLIKSSSRVTIISNKTRTVTCPECANTEHF